MSVITPTDEELRKELSSLLEERHLNLSEFIEQVKTGRLSSNDDFVREAWAWARCLPETKEICLR